MCLVEVTMKAIGINFVLGSVYIHSGTPSRNIVKMLYPCLSLYMRSECLKRTPETDIFLCGDFNIDILQNADLIEFMKYRLN